MSRKRKQGWLGRLLEAMGRWHGERLHRRNLRLSQDRARSPRWEYVPYTGRKYSRSSGGWVF